MGLATGLIASASSSRARSPTMCVVDVPVTSIVDTIDTIARHGAGRVIETVVSGRVRYSASH